MVQVKVGAHETLFSIHKKILCNVAPYFEAAFYGGFMEAKDQVLSLPDEDPVMFQHFELWVYMGDFLAKGETTANITWDSLVGLYIFGEICGIPDLQNAAIDVIIDKKSSLNYIPTAHLPRVYDNTPEDSPLRRSFVDWVACLAEMMPSDRHAPSLPGAPVEWFKEETRKWYPKDFLFDLVSAQNQLINGRRTRISKFNPRRVDYYVKPRDAPSKTPATGQK